MESVANKGYKTNKKTVKMRLDYGVKVRVGNFYILKYAKSLAKKELAVLRKADNIPADVRKHLQRRSLPYIKASTVTGSWSVEFVVGTVMYEALDRLAVVADADGNRQLYGTEGKNTEAILVGMLADTTTVGDFEYQKAKQKLLHEYLERAGKKLSERQDAGKSEEELKQESDDAVQEEIDDTRHASAIIEMGEHISEQDKR